MQKYCFFEDARGCVKITKDEVTSELREYADKQGWSLEASYNTLEDLVGELWNEMQPQELREQTGYEYSINVIPVAGHELDSKAYPAYLIENHENGTIYLSQSPKTYHCEACGDQDTVLDFVEHPAEALHVLIRHQADYTDIEGLNTSEGFKGNVRKLTGYDYTFDLGPVDAPSGYDIHAQIPSFYDLFPESE